MKSKHNIQFIIMIRLLINLKNFMNYLVLKGINLLFNYFLINELFHQFFIFLKKKFK